MFFSKPTIMAISALISTALAQSASTTATGPITTPTPTQPDMIDNCQSFYNVQTNDTCDAVASKFDLNFDVFFDWNPSVGTLCPDLILGDWVCIGTVGFAPAPTPNPIAPTTIAGCHAFYQVQSGDTCNKVVAETDLTLDQFYTWNPYLGSDCGGLALGYWVCVGA